MPASPHRADTVLALSIAQLIIRSGLINVIAFLGQVVVARILIPDDFGFFTVVAFIVNFSLLFCDFGSSWALIQNKTEPSRAEYASHFTIKLFLTLAVVTLLWLCAPLLPHVYSEFRAVHIQLLRVFSLSLVFISLKSVPLSIIERKMQYFHVAVIELCGVVFYQAVTLTLAWNGFGVWSLVWGVLAKEALEMALAFYYAQWRPTFALHLPALRGPLKAGGLLQLSTVLNFLHTAIVPVIVGSTQGMNSVGLLNWSSKIASIPTIITDSYGRAAFAGFSRLQHAPEMLRKIIFHSGILIFFCVGLFVTEIFLYAEQLMALVYSDVWLPALPALYWYTGATLGLAFTTTIGAVLLAVGSTKKVLYLNTFSKVLEWSLVFFLYSKLSFLAVPVAACLAMACSAVFHMWVGHRVSLFSFQWLGSYLQIFAAACITGLFFLFISRYAHFQLGFLSLFLQLSATAVVYTTLCMILLNKHMRELGIYLRYTLRPSS